jgi:hypothetical protein
MSVHQQQQFGRKDTPNVPMTNAQDHEAWLHSLWLMQMLSSGAQKGLWPSVQHGELFFHDLDSTVPSLSLLMRVCTHF